MTDPHDTPPEQETDAAEPGAELDRSDASTEGDLSPTRSASPSKRHRGRRLLLLLLPVLLAGGFVAALVTGHVPAGVGQLPRALAAMLPSKAPIGADNCVACHDVKAKGAAMYLAVNGTALVGNQEVTVAAGDTLELAFHFTGVLGDPARRSAVGAQIVVPDKPLWRVVPGTRERPKEWGPGGSGNTFWSPAWDNGGNGEGPQYLQWTSSGEAPGRYFLNLIGTPFPISEQAAHGAVLPDRGQQDPSDRDGTANHAGANAIVAVPAETGPGSYSVEIYGVGHDREGKRVNISKTVQVKVGTAGSQGARAATQRTASGEGADLAEGGTSSFVPAKGTGRQPTGIVGARPPASGQSSDEPGAPASAAGQPVQPVRSPGVALWEAKCGGCHGGYPNASLLANGEDMAIRVIKEGTKKVGGKMPPVGKSAGGTLSDEDIGLIIIAMTDAGAVQFGEGPNIPHGLDGREGKCGWCHDPGKAFPKPANHDTDYCTSCHLPPPRIPHSTAGREVCDACHSMPPVSR